MHGLIKSLGCLLLIVHGSYSSYHPPPSFNIVASSPILEGKNEISNNGVAIHYAILMALRELNDKTDGIADSLLPSTTLKVALRSPLPDFQDGVASAQEQIAAFDGEKVMGSIGPSDLVRTYGAARLFKDHHIPVIGYQERSSVLGLSDMFSNTLRTVPGDYIDGAVLADIVELLHWERVGLFSTSDTYGNMAQFFFEQKAKENNIEILSNIHISPDTQDFSDILRESREHGARIFVFLMHANVAARLMTQGYDMGVFHSKTQLLGCESSSGLEKWMIENPQLPDTVSGYIGVKYHDIPTDRPAKTAFIQRFRSQESTQSTGTHCNNDTDDTGYYLNQIDHDNDPSTPYHCIDMNFSMFLEDGSTIPPAAYHAYDAVYALAHALHSIAYTREVEFIDDKVVRATLLASSGFDGATGVVTFSSKFVDDGFDVGGRSSGVTFDVLNYDRSFKTREMKIVGTFQLEDGLQYCDGCSFVYTGSSLKRPLDRPKPISEHLTQAQLSAIIGLSCASLVVVVFSLMMFYFYRDTKLLKASQPAVGCVILCGCGVGSLRALTAFAQPNTALCMAQMWLSHVAFGVVFSALVVKSWKVHKVMNQTMKRIKLSTNTTLQIIGISMIPVCVYLLCVSTLGYVRKGQVLVYADQHEIIYEDFCHFELHDALVGLYFLELLAMVYGMYLCYLIRNVPDGISNMKAVANSK